MVGRLERRHDGGIDMRARAVSPTSAANSTRFAAATMLNPIADTGSISIVNSSAWAEPFARDNREPRSKNVLILQELKLMLIRTLYVDHASIIGTASRIAASLSTTLSGLVAANFGRIAVFLGIASVALLAVLMFWSLMPETRPSVAKLSNDLSSA